MDKSIVSVSQFSGIEMRYTCHWSNEYILCWPLNQMHIIVSNNVI